MPNPKPKTANANWYTIRAKGEDAAEVLIYGDIGDSWYGESVTAQQFVKDLQAIKDKNLVVRINSYGGSVSDGVAIYNAIKRHPKSKIVEIDGVAVSIASLIAMAGDTVRMAANALFMVHAPWGMSVGNAADMRKYAEVLDKYAEAMATSYAAKTGEASEAMYELLADGADHWYSAAEAKDGGFVDEVSTATQGEEAARYTQAALARFKVPAAAVARYAAVAAQFTPTKENTMTEVTQTPAATPKPDSTTVNVTEINTAAEARERTRIQTRNAEITTAFSRFMEREGVAALYQACLADTALSAEQASAKLLAKLGEGAEPVAPIVSGRVEAGQDEADKFRQAASSALLVRAGVNRLAGNNVSAIAIDLNGNPFRNATLLDIAKACVRRSGKNPDGMDKRQLVAAAFQTTSDFPVLLENTMHKTLLQAYRTTPDTWSRFCKVGSVSDFRAHNRYRSGSLGNLLPLNEHGEFKSMTVPDGEKASITAATKGGMIRISRQTIINDDLDALTDLATKAGRSAKRTIEADVYALLALNAGLGPVLNDALTLFHATHGNITTGAPLSVDAIDVDRVAMASQKDVGNLDFLSLTPAILLVAIGLGGKAREINAQEYNDESNKQQRRPNSVRGLFRDVVDSPRLTGTRRYLFADPADAPVIEVAFLDGNQEPFIEAKDGWDVDGAELKVREDFAVGGIDYRGAVTNAGV